MIIGPSLPASRRRRWATATLLALLVHVGGAWWLWSRTQTEPLSAPPEERLTFELREPAPPEAQAPEPEQAPDPQFEPKPEPPPPRVVERRPPAPSVPTEPAREEGSAEASDEELADFPRHPWGEPPEVKAPEVQAPEVQAPERVAEAPQQAPRGSGTDTAPRVDVGQPRALPVGKRRFAPSLLDRVMGEGPAGGALAQALKQAPAQRSAGERAKEKVDGWAGLSSRPDDGLRGRRVLAKTERGGYRWVDEDTGLPLPEGPMPRDTGWNRKFSQSGSNEGMTFSDADRPQAPKVDRDDLVALEDGGFLYETSGWTAVIKPDGEVLFDDNALSYTRGPRTPLGEKLNKKVGFDLFRDMTSGEFDATDALYRLAGKDPYYAAKSCFLDDVKPIREELRSQWQKARLEEAIGALRGHLEEIWSDGSHTPVQRRAAIFRLWDECNDEKAGALARRIITSWVRQRIPEGSADGYRSDELAALNAKRHSKARFSPYAKADPADAGAHAG